MVAPAAIAAGGQIAGSAMTNYTNYRLAKRQEQFQERMSSTAYQRAVADMRKAGLNPALAYQQGGASSPGGAKAEMEDMVSPALNSALAVRRSNAEIDNLKEQNRLLNAQVDTERGKPWNYSGSLRRNIEPSVTKDLESYSAKSKFNEQKWQNDNFYNSAGWQR